ncbi:MAG: AAA family ATPase, partial [Gemmatimonadota bacterium]
SPEGDDTGTMAARDVLRDLQLLFQSRYGLLHIETEEEERALSLLHHVSDRISVPLFTWTRIKGITRVDLRGSIFDTKEPGKALAHVAAADIPAIYHFHGIEAHLENDEVFRAYLKAGAKKMEEMDGAIVLTGRQVSFPPEIEPMVATLVLPSPGEEEYRDLLSNLIRDLGHRQYVEVNLTREEMAGLLKHLSGLTLLEAGKVLTKAIIEDHRLTAEDIKHVIEAKKAVVEREGLLEYYPVEQTLADIADLSTLKGWLAKRRNVVTNPVRAEEFGLSFPRGVLLLGVPGCGKSLSAKAVATEWGLPLLKFDTSNLYNKYIGESEKNFKRAIRAAERMAPVVLWIDELEKAFAVGGTEDGGVSQRILGSFLSWMQDRAGEVFIVATANDIERLPPEFLRKGRFDEIFFVDLPDRSTRREIFRIHLENRSQAASTFDLDVLAEAAEGFSGSEIEEVVVSGLYTAFSEGTKLTTEDLRQEVEGTVPLSVTMRERVEALRRWARDRTVPAN